MKKKPKGAPSREEGVSDEPRPGYIRDFVSGKWVHATPEEVEAVQVFAERLVKDYGYSKGQIQTRPQFRVRKRPADEEKSYPIDIAVFKGEKKIESELHIVVECKRKTRKDGIGQLKLYLDMSPAELGVWFNGRDHAYVRKIHHKDGRRTYVDIPNIPRHGQRPEDIGLYRRKDLVKPSNLKAVFRDLHNHLAGMAVGTTRRSVFAEEVIGLLFCKILDERETPPDEVVTFRAGVGEDAKVILDRVQGLFTRVKKTSFDDVFEQSDIIKLDAESIRYVVGELQTYCLMDADRDAIGEAFEVFIGPALAGEEGQFFTPRNVVKMMADVLNPAPSDRIIDPACGSGGFLVASLEHVWSRLREEGKAKAWTDRQLFKREVEVASSNFRGIDKDEFLAKVCKAYMALIGDGRGGVFCENSLLPPSEWKSATREKILLGSFDIVMTNPPFGKRIVVKGENVLSQYDLGFKWAREKTTGKFRRTTVLHEDQPPQILFLERCLQLLRPGGRLGIVLPEAIFGMPTYEYVVTYLRGSARILGVISMPEALFKTSGKGGTHAKVCVAFIEKARPAKGVDYPIFMAEAKWCGHDSRGNPTIRKDAKGNEVLLDDVPKIAARYHALMGVAN